MELLEAGKIVNTHGLRGEVKLVPWTDSPEVFEDLDYVVTDDNEKLVIKNVKYQKNNLIVKFEQIKSVEEAEKYKNRILYVERELLGELPDGKYYIADIIGMKVVDDTGRDLGVVSDVFNTGSNDIYTVKRDGMRDLLLPAINDVILNVDMEEKKITVHLMEGLEEL